MLRRLTWLLLATALIGVDAHAASQRERAEAVTREIQEQGTRLDGEHVTLWIARDSLTAEQAAGFLDLLDRGVVAIRVQLGPHVDEPTDPRRIEVFLSPRIGISHVRGDHPTMVYMPSRRVANRTAPYLHELVHAIASWSWRHSEWLGEGLANSVAAAVEAESGGYHYSPVLPRGLDDLVVHRDSAIGHEVRILIGAAGRRSNYDAARADVFAKVLRDRRGYAPPFYALAWSFTDFIIAREGLAGLRAIAADPVGSAPRVEALKQDWLEGLGRLQSAEARTVRSK
jgi:hypothetical protein